MDDLNAVEGMLPGAFTDPQHPTSEREEQCVKEETALLSIKYDVTVGRHRNMQIGR